MAISNVTAITVDHTCSVCGHSTPGMPLAQVLKNQEPGGGVVLTIVGGCESHTASCGRPTGECGRLTTGCVVHTESFNPNLSAADEVGREDVKQVRALYQALSLPVK